MTSSFGAFLDPVADKFLVTAALLVLVHLQRLHALVALVIIGREIAISAAARVDGADLVPRAASRCTCWAS
jgi:phosphatidylglycerophosphate synthase